MASVHKQSSHTTKSFSSTSSKDSSRDRNSADDLWDFYLPINRKGRFFQDSSFDQERDQFDSAIRDVLNKWGESDLLRDALDDKDFGWSKNLNRYRKLRSHNLKEDNQAVTVTSDNTCHKIVLDVHDFMDGEVKVKVVGERQLVVEGRMDATKARDLSGASHNFRRRFSLPDATNMDAITSVMSSDGILTITAPKIVHQTKDDSSIPIKVTGTKTNVTDTQTTTSTSQTGTDKSSGVANSKLTDKHEERHSCETQQHTEHKVPIHVTSTLGNNQCSSATQHDSSNSKAEAKREYNTASEDKKVRRESEHREHVSTSSDAQQSTGKQTGTGTRTQAQNTSSSTSAEFDDFPFSRRDSVPIRRKGHFFDDSFFADTRMDFQNAVNDVLKRWGESDLLKDALDDTDFRVSNNLKRYRKLRSHDLTGDNQAVTVTSDNTCHKIVLDVHEFMDGDVKVKVVGERELLVEGRMGATKARDLFGASDNFRRRFSLPDATNMDAITSVMSSDGILTIIAPKIVNKVEEESSTIPIKVTETKTKVTETQTTTSTSQAGQDNSTASSSSKLTEMQEEECHKNESRQNIAESKQSLEENTTPVKTDTTDIKDDSGSQMKRCHESSEQCVYSQEISKNSSSDFTEANSVNEKVDEEAKRQTDQTENTSNVSSQTDLASSSKTSEEKQSVAESSKGTAIPITTRGLFFNDTFFEDSWRAYQDAVKDVVIKWGDCSNSDDMTCYRRLRRRDMRDENQAVRSSEDEFSYRFIVDVHDFMTGGDITVKAVDDKELVVEGRIEKEEDGARSTKRFLRHFVLPGDVVLDSVSSVMSSDGVLTITAPKRSSKVRSQSAEQLQETTEANTRQQSASVRSKIDESRESSIRAATSSVVDESSMDQTKEHMIPVQVNLAQEFQGRRSSQPNIDDWDQSSEKVQHKASASRESRVNFDDESTQKQAAEKKDCTFLDQSEADAVNRRLEKERRNIKYDSDEDAESEFGAKMSSVKEDFDPIYKNRILSIKPRGLFSEDSFFLESRQNFKTAVNEVLKKSHTEISSDSTDDLASYRDLRLRNLKLENQATHVDEDVYTQTILLDVYDFLGGEVTAKVVEGQELVVEGRAQRQQGTSFTVLSFLRRFPLPERADLTGITAVVSSDGVLIIIVPKMRKYPKRSGFNKESSSERQSRMDTEMGRGLMDRNLRDSSREHSEGRTSRSLLSSRLRHSPELSSFAKEMSTDRLSRRGSNSDGGRCWEERKVQESVEGPEGCSSSTFNSSHKSRHQHSAAHQF